MIDLKNFNTKGLLNHLNGAAKEASNLLSAVDPKIIDAMTPEQQAQMKQAKAAMRGIKNKDLGDINKIMNEIKDKF